MKYVSIEICGDCSRHDYNSDGDAVCTKMLKMIPIDVDIPSWCPLESLPEWISVKDRLPEIGEEVLTYDGYHQDIGHLERNSNKFNTDWNGTQNSFVTHWQPLPAPPKEDEG